MKKSVRIISILLVLIFTLGIFSACSLDDLKPQSKRLIGKWVDTSSLNSGYEFMEDGKLKVTYANFNIPVINQVFDGSVDGIYTLSKSDDKNLVTISYTVLLQSIQKTYEFSVKDGILTLTDTDNGNQTLLQRGEVVVTSSDAA